MKKIILFSCWICIAHIANSQDTKYDPMAILLLDKMSDVIGDLSSCSYTLDVSHDEYHHEFGMFKQLVRSEVYMVGPDKMIVDSWSAKGHRQFWYNGMEFGYFDYEEMNYGLVQAPGNIISMIDSIHAFYNYDFPAADFFYPAFTDDLIENSDRIFFLGRTSVGGESCYAILSTGKEFNTQIWIGSDSYHLPLKYVITYHTQNGSPQYEATFSDWRLNLNIPQSMFNFLPPPGANEVRLFSKSDK